MADDWSWPHVRVEPGYRFGRPHVRGISAEAIGDLVLAGETVETVMENFELTRAEVLIACWYLGDYGDEEWRARWGSWGEASYDRLGLRRYDEVEDPPSDEELAGDNRRHFGAELPPQGGER